MSTLDSAPSWFCLLGIISIQDFFFNWDLVHFALCLVGSLTIWTPSTWGFGHVTFCPHRIVSTIGSVNSGICSCWVLSSWKSVQLGVWLLGIRVLGSLAAWHSAHVGMCPLLVLSTLNFAHVWSSLLVILSNWVFVYLDFFPLGVWPHAIMLT